MARSHTTKIAEFLEILDGIFDRPEFDDIRTDLTKDNGKEKTTDLFIVLAGRLRIAVSKSYSDRLQRKHEVLTNLKAIEIEEQEAEKTRIRLA